MRGGYKVRTVARTFRATPFDWGKRPEPVLRDALWTFLVMDCGHIKRDPWETYGNETAVKVQAACHNILTPDAVRRVRCYQCVSGRPQAGIPKALASPINGV
jgi:hypothetical protein